MSNPFTTWIKKLFHHDKLNDITYNKKITHNQIEELYYQLQKAKTARNKEEEERIQKLIDKAIK